MNLVAGRMSEGNFMLIDDPTTAVDGAVNDTDGAKGITADTLLLEDPVPKKKRSRFSFAKRKVVARSGMFSSDGLPIDGISGFMIGIILQCPRQQNQNRFYSDWAMHSKGMPSTIDRRARWRSRRHAKPTTRRRILVTFLICSGCLSVCRCLWSTNLETRLFGNSEKNLDYR
jgi:hypothetical protein